MADKVMMRLSDFIEQLQRIQEEHGDLPVTAEQWNDPNRSHGVLGAQVAEVKPDYSTRKGVIQIYARCARLETGGWGGMTMLDTAYMKQIRKRPTEKVVYIFYQGSWEDEKGEKESA